MRLDLEREFINRYVLKVRRSRYLGFIEHPKTRGKFLEMLYHGQDLDKSQFQDLRGNGMHEEKAILNKLSASRDVSCYVISVDDILDGKHLSVADALSQVVGKAGNLILFGEIEVVYYEGEAPYNRYLSK